MSLRSAYYFLLLCVFLCGCRPAGSAPAASPSATAFPSLPSLTNTPLPSATPSPSPTPEPAPEPTPAKDPPGCTEAHGRVERRQIASELLGKPLYFRLYLPPCYDPAFAQGYPALYLLHGQSSDDDQWQRLGAVETADDLITSGQAAPFLIVMPFEEYYLMDIDQSNFGRALVETLIPWIDQSYNTCTGRECRAIGGISRGATWAILLAFPNWELFSAVGAHSPPIFGYPNALLQWVRRIPEGQMPRVFIDIGTLDRFLTTATQFQDLLTRYKVPHEWHLLPGTHNEEYWRGNIEYYLRWYTKVW